MLGDVLDLPLLGGGRRIGLAPGVELVIPVTHAKACPELIAPEHILNCTPRRRERGLARGVREQQLAVVCDHHVMRYGLPYVLEGVRSVKASDEVVRRTAHEIGRAHV